MDNQGEFKDGQKHGLGVLTYKNCKRFEGEFYKNKKNGKGRFHYNDGKMYCGIWKDDVFDEERISSFCATS